MQAIVSSGAAARSRRCSERTVVRADIGRVLVILVLVQQRVVVLPDMATLAVQQLHLEIRMARVLCKDV